MLKNTAVNKEPKNKMEERPAKLPVRRSPFELGVNENEFLTLPFAMMRQMAENFESMMNGAGILRDPFRMLDPAFLPLETEWDIAAWAPQIEVLQRDKKFIVRAELPGVNVEDLKIEAADNWLTIEGERHNEVEDNGEGFYRSERSYGSFFRRIPLPEGVNAENASAVFADGVLEIAMAAPAPKAAAKRIEVKPAIAKARAAKAGK